MKWILGLLLIASLLFGQSYTEDEWQIEVVIPGNVAINTVNVYLEQTAETIQMYQDMPIEDLLALNPVMQSQVITPRDSIAFQMTLENNGTWIRAGAIGFADDVQMTGLGVSDIIFVPAEYEHIIPTVILRRGSN